MTVGISLTQGKRLEAIVIADSRVSSSNGRQSDSVTKMGIFTDPAYHGVLFGSGMADPLMSLNLNLPKLLGKDLEGTLGNVQQQIRAYMGAIDDTQLASLRDEVYRRSMMLSPIAKLPAITESAQSLPEDQRAGYVERKMREAEEEMNRFVQNAMNSALDRYCKDKDERNFRAIATLFDRNANRVRNFTIDRNMVDETFMDHIEIGSGSDGAHMYLASTLQGIKQDMALAREDLTLLAANAFNSSLINQGVGGTPKITFIDAQGAHVLPDERSRMLVNLSGAYLARFGQALTPDTAAQYVGSILANDKKGIREIAQHLQLNEPSFRTLWIPASSWQERSNEQFYSKK